MQEFKKSTYIIAAVSLLIIAVAVYFLFIFEKSPKGPKPDEQSSFVDDIAKIEIAKRPYVTLTPTSDGAEVIISIENMNYFDKIEYELTYLADNPQASGEKIERGSTGVDVNTKDQKYKKSMLLGTASKGTRSPDKGVSDGELTLHLYKGDTEYESKTNWDLFQQGTKPSGIADRKDNFTTNMPPLGKDYWIIIADTVGVPQNGEFDANKTVLPIYGVFSVAPQSAKSAKVSIKVNSDIKSPQLYTFDTKDEKWAKVDNKFQDSTVSASTNTFATFALVASQ